MNAQLICDNAEELALLSFILNRAGLAVAPACGIEEGMEAFVARPADLIVVALRQGSPASQVSRVRRDGEAGLIIICDPLCEDDVCRLLELGADMVIVRPYSARLLHAQTQALFRRTRGTSLGILPAFSLGQLSLDPSTRTVHVGDQPARRLTHLEFRLLYVLMLHRGQTLPTETIVDRVWGYDGRADVELVRGLVRRLRIKIEPDPAHPRYIVTEPAVGYRLQIADE